MVTQKVLARTTAYLKVAQVDYVHYTASLVAEKHFLT